MAGVIVSGFAGGFATVLEGAEVTQDFAENLRQHFTADYAWIGVPLPGRALVAVDTVSEQGTPTTSFSPKRSSAFMRTVGQNSPALLLHFTSREKAPPDFRRAVRLGMQTALVVPIPSDSGPCPQGAIAVGWRESCKQPRDSLNHLLNDIAKALAPLMPGHVATLLQECAYILPQGNCFTRVPEGRTDPDLFRRGSCNLEGWQRPPRGNPGAGRPMALQGPGSDSSPQANVERLTMRSRSCPSSLSGCRQTLLAALLMSSLNEDSAGAKVSDPVGFPKKSATQASSAPSTASLLEIASVRTPYLESIPGMADFMKQNGARFVY